MFTHRSIAMARVRSSPFGAARWASGAASSSKDRYKVLVVGAGSGGLTVANQIYNRFKAIGKPLNEGDVGILDAAEYHYYQGDHIEVPNTRWRDDYIPENLFPECLRSEPKSSRPNRTTSYGPPLVFVDGMDSAEDWNYMRRRRQRWLRALGQIIILYWCNGHYWTPLINRFRTLVGAGLKDKEETRRRLADLIPPHLSHIAENVRTFEPKASTVTTTSGRTIAYDTLVVATGLQTNWAAIPGLQKALADPASGVSSIYAYETCDKVWRDIDGLRSGKAIFTQPAGVIKCAGAPQKIMWMAWDRFRKTGRADTVSVDFYTGMPSMFSVKKYSDALDALRVARGVGGHLAHNLAAVDAAAHRATFKRADGTTVDAEYTLLHVSPPMGPLDALKASPLADDAGWVAVDPGTLRHVKPEFANVWALGDCSSLPTSKTAAAITAQAPVLTENLVSVMDSGKITEARYDGYTSCPLLTGYGELMLAEFKYGLEPKESFTAFLGDQAVPRRAFYHLKKDLFPYVYWQHMIKGQWYGTNGIVRPTYPQ